MELNDLISECTAYDFKVALEEAKPKSWLKSVSAFANGEGGSLFFGINNDHRVVGLEDVQHVTEVISSLVRDRMDPLPEQSSRSRCLRIACVEECLLKSLSSTGALMRY